MKFKIVARDGDKIYSTALEHRAEVIRMVGSLLDLMSDGDSITITVEGRNPSRKPKP